MHRERLTPRDRLMWSDLVEAPKELCDLLCQRRRLLDLPLVEVLVLQRLVETLDHTVGLGGVVTGADVLDVGLATDEAPEGIALEGGAVVGDHAQPCQLTALQVDAVTGQVMTEQLFGAADRHPQGLDGVATFGGRREVRGKHTFGRVVDHTADAPGVSQVVSNSVKSICQTRLRRCGGAARAALRAAAKARRSRW